MTLHPLSENCPEHNLVYPADPPIAGRRGFLKFGALGTVNLAILGSGWLGCVSPARADASGDGVPPGLTPDVALQKLMDGNDRFRQQRPAHPHQTRDRLQAVAQAQHPFATILSCADSRVPAEIIFDQGIGDLFDVRIAGNIATPEAIGSIEYAVALLGTPILMVLGHERCGAVTAAVQGEELPGEMGSFVKAILPVVDRQQPFSDDLIDATVTRNVQYQVEQLQRSPVLTAAIQANTLKIVGGRYDLDTGRVTLVTS